MSDPIQKALQKREALIKELDLIDQYIALHRQIFGQDQKATISTGALSLGNDSANRLEKYSPNNPKIIADQIEEILVFADRPMTRGELSRELTQRGFEIHSRDVSKYLGTIMWRNSERFINIEGSGYWLKNRALPQDLQQKQPSWL